MIGQTHPGGLVTHTFEHDITPPGTTTSTHDWIYAVNQNADGTVTCSGYSGPDTERAPCLVTMSKDLEYINHAVLNDFEDENGNTVTHTGFGTFTDIRPVDNSGTIAAGRILIIDPNDPNKKLSKPAVCQSNGDLTALNPRTYFASNSTNFQLWAIREYRNSSGTYSFIACGFKENSNQEKKWFILGLDQNLAVSFSSTVKDANGVTIKGELAGICYDYPSGSLPGGLPVVKGEKPDHVMLSGFCVTDANEPANAMVMALDFDDLQLSNPTLTVVDEKRMNADPNATHYDYTSSFFDYTEFPVSNWPCSAKTDPSIVYDSDARRIEQNLDGQFVASLYTNYINLKHASTNPSTQTCQEIINQGVATQHEPGRELRSANLVFQAFEWDANTSGQLNNIAKKHMGHIGGFDIDARGKFDYNGDIYLMTSCGDFGHAFPRENQPTPHNNEQDYYSNYILYKASLNQDQFGNWSIDKEYHQMYMGAHEPTTDFTGMTCAFDLVITEDNDIVGGGDNKDHETLQGDNFDLIKIRNDCGRQNTSIYKQPNIVPNIPGTNIYSVKYVCDNVIFSPKLTWGADKVVNAQIVIEDGYELEIPFSGTKIEFYDALLTRRDVMRINGTDASIVIKPGGKLTLEDGVELTALDDAICYSSWGGVSWMQAII